MQMLVITLRVQLWGALPSITANPVQDPPKSAWSVALSAFSPLPSLLLSPVSDFSPVSGWRQTGLLRAFKRLLKVRSRHGPYSTVATATHTRTHPQPSPPTHPPSGSVRSHTRTPPFSLGPEAGRGLPAARARPARSATKGKRRGGARVSPAGMSPLSGGPDLGTQTPQRGAAASPWPPSARLRVPNSPLPSGERRGV